jgi:hypothetical protein
MSGVHGVLASQCQEVLGIALMFGMAERGPVDRAVKITSVDDYAETFGGRSGGSLLYDSVSAYFAEGGDSLYVVRQDMMGTVDALDEAIKAARLFNRGGMTWLEYDRLLVRLEGVVNHARGSR